MRSDRPRTTTASAVWSTVINLAVWLDWQVYGIEIDFA
jgi:hypothetical protein